ncbi:MAG: hypothetical protein ACOC32_05135 [Nanoarchaeota archaeon]
MGGAPDQNQGQPPQQPETGNGSNVMRPQEQNMQKNAQQVPRQRPKTAVKAKQPKKQESQEQQMSVYEKRFREFLKNKFGGMIGNTLLTNELDKLNISNISNKSDQEQIQVMENVLHGIFEKHSMAEAEEHTKLEMKLQLCLDETASLLKNFAGEVEIKQIDINHNNRDMLKRYRVDAEEKDSLCTIAEISGTMSSKAYIMVDERMGMMLMTEYAKKQGKEFNPLDEKQKNAVYYEFLRFIFDNYLSVVQKLLDVNISYKLTETKDALIDTVEEIEKEIEAIEKERNGRVDLVSAETKIIFDRQTLPLVVFVAY